MGYKNPLESRYASKEMLEIFSEEAKFLTWRDCWIALAEAEKELGLNITDEQIEDLKNNRENLNLERAKEIEKTIHHDVMSHIKAYAEVAKKAAPIIHLGATSAYITDNSEMILIKKALILVRDRMINLLRVLKDKALKYKDLPMIGYTHLQPAQPTTLGKRIALWIYDLILDFYDLEYRIDNLITRGAKGTTGTQASFYSLFNYDDKKVVELDNLIAKKLGFKKSATVSGQTLTRKVDFQIMSVLSSIAQSSHKAANDFRILQHRWEIEEPFDKEQVGSSAMPYKRNPILAERMTSLARLVINNLQNAAYTYANQFLERTLDDSANKRIVIAETFLAIDSILIIYKKLIEGMNVYEEVIKTNMINNLPFYATENILMTAVKNGGNRQELHEIIREYSMRQIEAIRKGEKYDLIGELKKSNKFNLTEEDWKNVSNLNIYTGRASQQVEDLIKTELDPILEKYKDVKELNIEIRV